MSIAVIFVVVCINNHLQACIFGIAHNLVHAIQPSIVKNISRSLADMAKPGNGNTHAGETLGLYAGKGSLCGRGAAPGSLAGNAVIVGIKMVTHIPAKTKLPCAFHSGVIRKFGIRNHLICGLGHANLFGFHAGGRYCKIGTAGLVQCIGGRLQRNGNLVVLEHTVGAAEPTFCICRDFHFGTGRRGDSNLQLTAVLGNRPAGLA